MNKENIMHTVSVFDIVEKEFCVSIADGEKVFSCLCKKMEVGEKIALSFKGIGLMTSAFLNAAIGRLYGKFDERKIRSHLLVEGAEKADMALIENVKKYAKLYYEDPTRFERGSED